MNMACEQNTIDHRDAADLVAHVPWYVIPLLAHPAGHARYAPPHVIPLLAHPAGHARYAHLTRTPPGHATYVLPLLAHPPRHAMYAPTYFWHVCCVYRFGEDTDTWGMAQPEGRGQQQQRGGPLVSSPGSPTVSAKETKAQSEALAAARAATPEAAAADQRNRDNLARLLQHTM